MDKQSDFSRWLLSKFCAAEGEVLQVSRFLWCSWDPLSFQASGQAHYLPQWWQCAVQQMARCNVIAPVEGGHMDHIWHPRVCSTGICTTCRSATEIWTNLGDVHLELLLKVIYSLTEWLYQGIDHFVLQEVGCLLRCFNTWDPDFFSMLQSAPKMSISTATSPLGRFSVLPSNAKQLCLLSNLRMTPWISWRN